MRVPGDVPQRSPRTRHRRRWWILALIIVVIIVLASLRTLATLYTDALWFDSVGLHAVWTRLVEVKLGLFASFGAIFFVLAWVNLVVTDRLSVAPSEDAEDELVRRYQRAIRPYAGWVYSILGLVMALVAASTSIGEWQNWILFTHSTSFGTNDPQFHKDVGFFVFKLPFLSFVVNWALVSLVVVTVVVAIFHYLNGGIRPQRPAPRVRPAVKAHLSVLLALIAVVKAAGYIIARYQLDVSNNGYVEGAGYTDVHARLPALQLLFWVSLAAAAVLLWNIWRQGWTLPTLAIGVWAFVALVIGVIYPSILQAVRVNPAQSSQERPYIARNIQATRAAYEVEPGQVHVSQFAGNAAVSGTNVFSSGATLHNIRLWDPEVADPTVQKQQDHQTYYQIPALSVDRYSAQSRLNPAIVGVRQINSSGIQSQTWVNTHLVYTHGEGMVAAPANQATSSGTPSYTIAGVPPTSNRGWPEVKQPDVYFATGESGWVIANSKQPEIDYQTSGGNISTSHYQGSGGVQLSSFLRQAAFAVRLGDFNLLVSSQINSKSRIMFVRDIRDMAEKAAPFLTYEQDPYPVLINGHIDWVLNAYTSTSEYPYSQNAGSFQLPSGSTFSGDTNYARNSVAVVVDAYSGKMTFYALNSTDPILRAYEATFPGVFTPKAEMPPGLLDHLRYPPGIFGLQSAVYGRYRVSSPSTFYGFTDAWNISQAAGVGSPSQALEVVHEHNAQGQLVAGPIQRMQPIYQLQQLPGTSQQTLTLTEAYVPTSPGDSIQTLSGFMIAKSDANEYGRLNLYQVKSQNVSGPALVDSDMLADSKISAQISLLNQGGSSVLLGNVLPVPIGQSMLYVRPLYVTSNRNPFPILQYVIADDNGSISMQPTLNAALSDVLGIPVTGAAGTGSSGGSSSSGSGTLSPSALANVRSLLNQAATDYAQAQKDLSNKDLGAYESDIANMNMAIHRAQGILGSGASSGTNTPSSAPSSTTSSTTTSTTSTTSIPTSPAPGTATTAGSTTTTAAPNGPSTSPNTTNAAKTPSPASSTTQSTNSRRL